MLLDPTSPTSSRASRKSGSASPPLLPRGQNLVILVDAASSKKKGSDYTAMWCLGLGSDRKVYIHDMLRDRLSLTERADILMAWHRKWQPMAVGYEQYGMMADIEHIRSVQDNENYRFDITPLGGTMAKNDRIRRLVPWFEKGNSTSIRRSPRPITRAARSTSREPSSTTNIRRSRWACMTTCSMRWPVSRRGFADPLPARSGRYRRRRIEMAEGRNPVTGY
jgi:hypothetical protein